MPPRRPSRFTWIYVGVVALAGVAGQVCLYWLPSSYPLAPRFVLSLSVGLLCGSAFFHFFRVLMDERIWRGTHHLPKSIQFERQDDGSWVAFVTALDGEPQIVKMREGYDPAEDEHGREFFETLGVPYDLLPGRESD